MKGMSGDVSDFIQASSSVMGAVDAVNFSEPAKIGRLFAGSVSVDDPDRFPFLEGFRETLGDVISE